MNIAVIFAGGTGLRMRATSKPKQFLELHGKPILIYTLENFQNHQQIDGIVLVCLESWIDYCNELLQKYHITKVLKVVPGGSNGQESIFNGLKTTYNIVGKKETVVLIHDGVRPLINEKLISECIAMVNDKGNAITVTPAIETILIKNTDGSIGNILKRSECEMAKAPQCFYLSDIYNCHLKSKAEGKDDFIDSASLMQYYGYKLNAVEGPMENIKITTPADFYIFRAIMDARENLQILGL